MNRYHVNLGATTSTNSIEMNALAKLFIVLNTIGVNPSYRLSNGNIEEIQVDLPFDEPFPDLSSLTNKLIDDSEISSSLDFRLFPYVTLGSVVCVVAKDDTPTADLSRYNSYVISVSDVDLIVYVGIANSSLTESYAPFGVREGVKPANIVGMAVTSVNALQTMLNNCSCPTINPSTGLSASDLRATSL